jgi:hypothetical protein
MAMHTSTARNCKRIVQLLLDLGILVHNSIPTSTRQTLLRKRTFPVVMELQLWSLLKGSRWKWIWQSYALTLKPWWSPLKLIRCVLVRTLVLHDPAGSKAQYSWCSIWSYVLDTRRCKCWYLSGIRCDHKHHQWRIRMWKRLWDQQKSA